MTAPTSMTVKPLWDGFGVEVTGIDLSKCDQKIQDDVVEIFHLHGAVVVRDQTLTPEQQMSFTRRFGPPETNSRMEYTLPGFPEIYVISNKKVEGRAIGDYQAGLGWHTDSSYLEKPALCTMLYALEVPEEGSDTLLADLCAAYKALPEDRRTGIDDLKIHHSYKALMDMKGVPLSEAQMAAMPDVVHPMVRTHPADGRKALWVSTGTTLGVIGMENPEGLDLIHEMVAHATSERFVHAHKWRKGDVLIWDNRCTLHRGTSFDIGKYTRLVHRSWVKGDRPV
jgi:taurine dioxygenase